MALPATVELTICKVASKTSKIYAAWNEYRYLVTQKAISLRDVNVDEIISSFFCPGPFYYYVFDFASLTLVYIHPNVEQILGLPAEDLMVDKILARAHPDDIPHMANGERMGFDFIIKRVLPSKRRKYKLSYCFRMKVATGSFKLFLQQAVPLTLDEQGNLGMVLGVHCDISHLTTVNSYKVSIIGMDGEPSYPDLDPVEEISGFVPSRPQFSKREVEIIMLLAEGLPIHEISDKLFISNKTVITHQRNVLKKSGCKNTIELVSKCIREGLI